MAAGTGEASGDGCDAKLFHQSSIIAAISFQRFVRFGEE
jgi:hypothetical protein